MTRRAWLLVGAGLAAGAAGVSWRAWRNAAPPTGAAGNAGSLWRARFARPDGTDLALAVLRGSPLVVNFWATWCPPCIEEMPDLDRFAREFSAQGWRVVGLALDKPAAVRAFLSRSPVGYEIGIAGFEGTALARELGNAQGGLPFTVVVDRQGEIVQRRLGQTRYDELAHWAQGA
jgi:thiol-disulfide isomerase/thioredoxin